MCRTRPAASHPRAALNAPAARQARRCAPRHDLRGEASWCSPPSSQNRPGSSRRSLRVAGKGWARRRTGGCSGGGQSSRRRSARPTRLAVAQPARERVAPSRSAGAGGSAGAGSVPGKASAPGRRPFLKKRAPRDMRTYVSVASSSTPGLIALGVASLLFPLALGGWAWGLAWLSADFVGVGVAYLARTHTIFGKQRDGTLRTANLVVLLPFLLLTWMSWHAMRLLSREPPLKRLAPNLVIGRRPLRSEVPNGIDAILDGTAEFAASASLARPRTYSSFPILDAGVPPLAILHALLNEIPNSSTVLVHCAQGHGRSRAREHSRAVAPRLQPPLRRELVGWICRAPEASAGQSRVPSALVQFSSRGRRIHASSAEPCA